MLLKSVWIPNRQGYEQPDFGEDSSRNDGVMPTKRAGDGLYPLFDTNFPIPITGRHGSDRLCRHKRGALMN